MSLSSKLALSLGILLVASTALADIPPPDDYVETCTIAIQQAEGEECVSCSAWHGEATVCSDTYAPQGYTHRCHSYGASSWGEVWCRPLGTNGSGDGSGDSSEREGLTRPRPISALAPVLLGISGIAATALGFGRRPKARKGE